MKMLIGLLLALLPWAQSTAHSINCDDLHFLIAQSSTGFQDIASDVKSESGGVNATRKLTDAEYCEVIEDVEKRSYRCTWKYPYADARASAEYTSIANHTLGCLGSQARVASDQMVNHPDTYKSFLYTLNDTNLRVTLKDKRALNSSFVSLVIEGQRNVK